MDRDSTRPDPLGAVLQRALGRRRLAAVLTEATIAARWEEAVGPQVAARARPEGLREGVLTLRVASAPWMSELSLRKPRLLARINAVAGAPPDRPAVTDLRFVAGQVAPPAPPP
ncbi:MAG TPA: DUF721 domain-containing protein, partial [Thermodesulfobacteriota bacterium]|nr:DUF721 domain-containing protein [Thermodesulfobacteriota bacterium]